MLIIDFSLLQDFHLTSTQIEHQAEKESLLRAIIIKHLKGPSWENHNKEDCTFLSPVEVPNRTMVLLTETKKLKKSYENDIVEWRTNAYSEPQKCFLHYRWSRGTHLHPSCPHIIWTLKYLEQSIETKFYCLMWMVNWMNYLPNKGWIKKLEYAYVPVGGSTLSTNIKMAFSALRSILLRIT